MPLARTLRDLARRVDNLPFAPAKVGDKLIDLHVDRSTKNAATDPEWAAIEARRTSPNHGGVIFLSDDLTWDDFERQNEIANRITPTPWWMPVARALSDAELADVVATVTHAAQRVRRGWDDVDAWNLGPHLCRHTGEQLLHLAKNANGWPSDDEFPTYDDWTAALTEHGQVLLDAHNDFEDDNIVAAQASMRWVADHLGHLWD